MARLTDQERARRHADRLVTAAEHLRHARNILADEAGNQHGLHGAIVEAEQQTKLLARAAYTQSEKKEGHS